MATLEKSTYVPTSTATLTKLRTYIGELDGWRSRTLVDISSRPSLVYRTRIKGLY